MSKKNLISLIRDGRVSNLGAVGVALVAAARKEA
jgi:hypothetical protein